MRAKDRPLNQVREEFIQQMFEKILDVPEYSNFRTNTFCVIASLGLQSKADEERLFEDSRWNSLEFTSELLEKIKGFLKKYIR